MAPAFSWGSTQWRGKTPVPRPPPTMVMAPSSEFISPDRINEWWSRFSAGRWWRIHML